MTKIPQSKIDSVKEFAQKFNEYPIIGVVNLKGLQTKQLQKMRINLRDMALIKMTKKRLIKIALKDSKVSGIEGLDKFLEGIPAIIFTKENPSKLYKILEKSKSSAPAKAGQIAPKDIVVKAGPTGFSPGPVIGQLGKFGIKAGVEAGKIAIKEDKIVLKKGEEIKHDLAEILLRLGVEPMEVGLNLVAVYENGAVYESDILAIDESEYMSKIATAFNESMNLSVYSAYPTKENINILLGKVYQDSKALAMSESIITDDNLADLIAQANASMIALASNLSEDALSDDLKTAKSNSSSSTPSPADDAEPKTEEKPKEEEKKPEAAAAGLGSLFG